MRPSAIERYTAALVAAAREYDRSMGDIRQQSAVASTISPHAAAAVVSVRAAGEAAAAAVDNYIKALREARRSYELALGAAAKAANQ